VSELELREIVGSVQGSLVAGPSAHGVYELALPDAAQLDASLRRLRADPRVRLSEPLRAGSAPR
jgi:hypothetical protein